MISIIIRAKDEERWIIPCLRAITQQDIDCEVEIVLVDNNSLDKTVEKAISFVPELKLVSIDKFFPGLAINIGIRASSGEFLVCLSSHCIPANKDWLRNLKENFKDPDVAGVYGRQIPMESTNDLDKRDLLVTFGLDKRIQIKDPFFHNANSMFRRNVWNNTPFDENATNIEDRIWGSEIIKKGLKIAYEPEASVYHHHGIHQSRNEKRCSNIVRIMEGITIDKTESEFWEPMPTDKMEVVAFIPWRSNLNSVDSQLAQYSIEIAVNSGKIDKVVVLTDDENCKSKAEAWGAWVPFLRPKKLSGPDIRLNQVLQFALNELEGIGYYPDIIVLLEMIYPFRPANLLDLLVEHLVSEGVDTAIAGVEEYRPCWRKENDDLNFTRLDDFKTSMTDRDPLQIGLPGLGCATFPEIIRKNKLIGEKVGIFEISNFLHSVEIRSQSDLDLFNSFETSLAI